MIKRQETPLFIDMRRQMSIFLLRLQNDIVSSIQGLDSGKKFLRDIWIRNDDGTGPQTIELCLYEGGKPLTLETLPSPEFNGGISCILQEGEVFEKAGINVSIVHGILSKAAFEQMKTRHREIPDYDMEMKPRFFAAGISLVIHPHNPHAPTIHMNYRYFEVQIDEGFFWWFGGGTDLTPSYLYDEDAIHFHQTLKNACDQIDPIYYRKFKKWCDDYFVISFRGERRGIGGIFFDDLDDRSKEHCFLLVQSCGEAFIPCYVPLILKRSSLPFTPDQKRWQQLRRGRYVEFNLVYDRGTKFGLSTVNARIESILMSLPLTARWEYNHVANPDTEEARLMKILEQPIDWVPLGPT